MHGLTTIFLVRELGIKDQQLALQGPNLIFGVWSKRRSTSQNQEHLMNWNNKFFILLPLFLLKY